MGLRKGTEAVTALKSIAFEAGSLPESEKERLCRDLLAEFGVTQIHQRGYEMIHSCPLPYGGHKNGDADASASLNYDRLVFNCQGCGSAGGFLWFIATCRGEDTAEARRWLEDQTGAGPDEQSLSSLLQFFDSVYGEKQGQRAAPIPKMSPTVLKPWMKIHPYLTDPPSEGGRGISEETVVRFQVGYAEDYKARVGETFVSSPRIVLPHFWKGELVGWQTRRLTSDGTPKYLSSPDFPKDTTVYAYDPKAREAVVLESPMSALIAADDPQHYEATFGAKVTDRQINLLTMHPRLILWMDNDEAGWAATERIGNAALAYCDVWVVDSPYEEDAGDLPAHERQRLLTEELVSYSLWKPPKILTKYHQEVSA